MKKYFTSVSKTYIKSFIKHINKTIKSFVVDETMGDRMKRYESTTTDIELERNLPVYVRLDMRAGHSFCRGLDKPFDDDYSFAMKEATKYMVDKTGAILGYTQSDEISLVYEDCTKMPFENRLFKLQSVFASMATGAFIINGLKTKLKDRIESKTPSFDCRVMNLPSMKEAANMILWRSMDSVKNSITLVALEHFSNKEIHKKNGNEKIQMLKEKGVDYFSFPEGYRYGFFFRRVVYPKILSNAEIEKIPEKNRPPLNENGECVVIRSKIDEFQINNHNNLIDAKTRQDFLFRKCSKIT